MVPRWKQQLGGLFIALVGAGFTGWTWYTALVQDYFSRKASMLSPAFFVLGVGLILFPSYKEERIARGEDVSGMRGLQLLTVRWWVIIFAALVAAGANIMILSSFSN